MSGAAGETAGIFVAATGDNYQKTRHSTGLTILSEKLPNVRSVTFGFWVRTGARREPKNIAGISHFIEHLLFKGSMKYSAKEIAEIFDSMGGEINAMTGKEYTCFYARVIDEKLEEAFSVISDMLQKPKFDPVDISNEIKVVLEEISLYEDTPDEKIHDIFIETLMGGHPLGKSILGDTKTVSAFNSEKASGYFATHYMPSNMVLAAAGSVDHHELCKLAEKYFKENSHTPTKAAKKTPMLKGGKRIVYKDTEQVHICYGTGGYPAGHPDRYALSILDTVLGGGMSYRLFQEIREKRGLAYSVFSYHSMFSDTGTFAVYTGTRKENAQKALNIIRKELKSLSKSIGREEFVRSKEHLKGQLVLALESSSARMTRLGKAELQGTEILTLDEVVDRVEAVKREDVVRVASDLFREERMVLTAIGPLKENDLI